MVDDLFSTVDGLPVEDGNDMLHYWDQIGQFEEIMTLPDP